MQKLIPVVLAVCACSISAYTDHSHNAIQILRKLGMADGAMLPDIKHSKGKRKNDSPIYYIKLPPTPHFYHHRLPPMVSLLPPPMEHLHHLPIDFTNNGRPELVRNWHYPPQLITNPTNPTYSPLPPFHLQSGYVSSPYMSNEVDSPDNPLLLPPQLPLMSNKFFNKIPTYPLDPAMHPVGNSLISLKDHYTYNGKPSSVYIWKPHKTIPVAKPKYRHHYFKDFNY